MTKGITLVLSGSGVKFPVFIGGLRRLEEAGYHVEAVVGTSGGAIVAAGMASGFLSSEEMEGLVRDLMPKLPQLIEPSVISLVKNFGFFKTRHLREVFKQYFKPTLGQAVIPCKIVTADVDASGEEPSAILWSSSEDLEMSLPLVAAASMAIPFVFEQVLIHGHQHVDGGLLKNFAVDAFPEKNNIVGLTFSGKLASHKDAPWYKPITRLVNRFLRLMDLVMVRNVREDIEDAKGAVIIPVKTRIDGLDFKITDAKITEMIEDGYRAVDEYIKQNGKIL